LMIQDNIHVIENSEIQILNKTKNRTNLF